jgi:glycosyltransferase involved in cell wall biosynthesis
VQVFDILTESPLLIIPVVFFLVFLIQMIYYLGIYARILFYKENMPSGDLPPVSVIISARNEEDNLEKNLPSLLKQDYPEYEVIVVNDESTDDSDMVVTRLQQQYKHLQYTEIKRDNKFSPGKKLAVTLGIKKAKYEWVLLTDADCQPNSDQWIRSMAKNFGVQTSIVLGYGGYKKYPGLLNTLIRYDTLTIALQYFTYALAGFPYMGVGRNLAYKRKLFFDNKGFAGHYHLDSGDDDLFVNKTALKSNTSVQISQESTLISEPHRSFSDWFKQKRRHLSTAFYYKKKTRWRLLTEIYSRIAFYIFFILSLCIFPEYYLYILGIFAFRWIVQLVVYKNLMNRLGEKNFLLLSIFYDIFIPFINFIGIITNKIHSNNAKWR